MRALSHPTSPRRDGAPGSGEALGHPACFLWENGSVARDARSHVSEAKHGAPGRVLGDRMITKVKCVKEGCELKDHVISTSVLFINNVAPLDGPFPCQRCGEPMKVVSRVPSAYKGNSAAKTSARRTSAKPGAKRLVGKKRKPKGIKIKMSGALSGYQKLTKKAGARKSGPRKRGPSK